MENKRKIWCINVGGFVCYNRLQTKFSCVAISYFACCFVSQWQGNLVVIAGNLVEKIGAVAGNL